MSAGLGRRAAGCRARAALGYPPPDVKTARLILCFSLACVSIACGSDDGSGAGSSSSDGSSGASASATDPDTTVTATATDPDTTVSASATDTQADSSTTDPTATTTDPTQGTDATDTGSSSTDTGSSSTDATGTGSSSTDPSAGSSDTGVMPTSGYGDCVNNPEARVCVDGEICALDPDGQLGFCTFQGCADETDCPSVASGNPTVTCIDANSDMVQDCMLGCSMGETCPDGMVCVFAAFCVWQAE